MAVKTRASMPVICAPRADFSFANLDTSNSTYTETGLEPGVPTAADVATDHSLSSSTTEGISSAYTIDLRVADEGTGTIGGPNSSTWIYRDTSESAPQSHWHGWNDLDIVRDIESVNTSAGSTNENQYPAGVADKHGNLYVVCKYGAEIRQYKRSADTGTWAASTIADETTLASDAAEGMEPDICYVPERDELYAVYPTKNDDTTEDYVSVGVSVSADQGATWKLITKAILPFDSANSLVFDPQLLQALMLEYNPFSHTFTLAFEYWDGSSTYVNYYATLDRAFTLTQWSTLDDLQYPDLVIDPYTGREYLLAYNTDTNDLELRTKEAGQLFFPATAEGSYTPAAFSTSTSITGWMHHSERPVFLWSDVTNDNAHALFVESDLSLSEFDSSGISNSVIANTGGLRNVNVVRYHDRVYLLANPRVGNIYEILCVHLGGWDSTPNIRPETCILGPWDVPSNQGPVSWTESDAGTGVVESNWDAGYLSLETSTGGGTSNTGYVSGSVASNFSLAATLKVEVDDAYSSVGSVTRDGYVFFEVTGDNGTTSSNWGLYLSETGFNVIDYNDSGGSAVGSNTSASLQGNPHYFKIAYTGNNHSLTVWHSPDGMSWTEAYDVTLQSGSSSGAGTDFEWGVDGASGSPAAKGYWSLLAIEVSGTATPINRLLNYNDYTNSVSSDIDLDGMPLSRNPAWVSKGLEISASGYQASGKEHWQVSSVATNGVQNALIDGDDSPRVKWTQSSGSNAVLKWDTSSAPINLSRGFLYLQGTGISNVLLEQTDVVIPATTTLVNKSTTLTLAGNWARSGNVLYPTSSASSVRWFKRDSLKGSYVTLGSNYYKVARNTAGYWANDGGDVRMMIELEGDPSSESASGSNLVIAPTQILILWSISNPLTSADDFTLTLTSSGGSGVIDAGKILIGDYYPIPVSPLPGRSRSTRPNTSRTYSRGGYSYGETHGPTGKSRSFTLRSYDPGETKYSSQSSLGTHQVSWGQTNQHADASQALEALESLIGEYGMATPIVWCDLISEEPGSGASAVVEMYEDRLIYGTFDVDSIDVISESGKPYRNEVQSISQVVIRELV